MPSPANQQDPVSDAEQAEVPSRGAAPRPRRAWARAGLYLLGAGLLGGAVWAAAREHEATAAAWRAVGQAPWWAFAGVLGAPLLSWVMTSWMFCVLTERFGRVGQGEMLALIGSSWLLNLVPMRPGMAGRMAYLKAVRGISLRDLVVVGAAAAGCTAACGVILGGAALALRLSHVEGAAQRWWVGAIVVGAAAWTALAALLHWRWANRAGKRWDNRPALASALALALGVRALDMLLMGVRLWLAHQIIGRPLDGATALWLAWAAQVAGLLPVQLGVQEWTVGLMSASTATGLSAAFVNRAADLVVCLPVGLGSMGWLWMLGRGAGRGADRPHAAPGRTVEPG